MVSINAPLQKGVVTPYGGLVGMEGFEPSKPVAPVLQTGLIRHHQSIPVFVSVRIRRHSNIHPVGCHTLAGLSTRVPLE
jgi:hypothetical protein